MKITLTIECKDDKLLDAIESIERNEASDETVANALLENVLEKVKMEMDLRLKKKIMHLFLKNSI